MTKGTRTSILNRIEANITAHSALFGEITNPQETGCPKSAFELHARFTSERDKRAADQTHLDLVRALGLALEFLEVQYPDLRDRRS